MDFITHTLLTYLQGEALTEFMITEIKHGHNTFLLYAREMSKSENDDLIEISGCTNFVPPNR